MFVAAFAVSRLRAVSVNGIKKTINVTIWRSSQMDATIAKLPRKLPPEPTRRGASPPPSVPAVVPQEIQIDSKSSSNLPMPDELLPSKESDEWDDWQDQEAQTAVLFVLFKCLLENTFNKDVIWLAIHRSCGILADVIDRREVERMAKEWIEKASRKDHSLDIMF